MLKDILIIISGIILLEGSIFKNSDFKVQSLGFKDQNSESIIQKIPEKENKNGIWVGAGDLKPGMKVLGANGEWVEISSIEIVKRHEKTYNFEVKENHTYTVGNQNVVVHNLCEGKKPFGRALTRNEEKEIKRDYPYMNPSNVLVTDEVDPKYNCIAWTLGMTDIFFGLQNSLSEQDAFYKSYGYVPTGNYADAEIAIYEAYGEKQTMPIHAARRICGETWESKLGAGVRVMHHLSDLETDYVQVTRFYKKK